MQGIVQKIENGRAHIRLDDGQVLHVPVADLAAGVRVTSVVNIRVDSTPTGTGAAADDTRQKLNDILSSTPE